MPRGYRIVETDKGVIADPAQMVDGQATVPFVQSLSTSKLLGADTVKQMLSETVMASPPTVSENASTGITSVVTKTATSSRLRVCGAPVTIVASPYLRPRDSARVDGAESTTAGQGPCRIDFLWQGTKFEARMFAGANRNYRIWKDGQLVASSMATSPVALTVTSAETFVRVDFTSRLTLPAHITVELSGTNGFQFSGIAHEPDAFIAAPPVPSPRVHWLADSFGAGTGATDRCMSYPILAGRALGWQDVWTFSSVASTGLVTPTGTYKDYGGRAGIDVAPYSPDIVVIQGSINDLAAVGANTIGPRLTSIISTIKAVNPGVKIVATSPLWLATGSANQTAYESIAAEMSSAASSAGAPFLDLITSNPYFTGTGRVGSTTGDGPADTLRASDGTHPSQLGHRTLASVMARLLSDALGVTY